MPPRNKGFGNLNSQSDETWDGVPHGSSFKESLNAESSQNADHDSADHSLNLQGLPQSIKLHILQFLDLVSLAQVRAVHQDLHQLLTVNTSSRRAVAGEGAYQAVWKPAISRQWPWVNTNNPNMRLQNSIGAGENDSRIDLARLLSLAAEVQCHSLDQDRLVPSTPQSPTMMIRPARHGRFRSRLEEQEHPPPPHLFLLEGNQNVVLFSGALGVGDRCVRSKDPLPRPTAAASANSQPPQKLQQPKPKRGRSSSAFRLHWCKETAQKLLHLKSTTKQQHQPVRTVVPWKPFVAPFAASVSTYDLSPRLVNYFEIVILPSREDSDANNKNNNSTTTKAIDCIAIGVALRDFQLHKDMPGWCRRSFGYHGDDGGFYHASGRPHVNVHLPTYGAGDCVGCGMDYIQRALFFTKNGQFLGYVAPLFEDQLRRDWFPVVGMDTHCPVQCNFGTSTDMPFRYDLSGLVKLQREVVLQALALSIK